MKFLPTIFCALMLAGTTMFAQEQQPPNNNQNRQTTTVTGCLTKSSTNGEYVLSEQNTGQKYTFNAPAQLDNYINHTVQMTGRMMNNQNGDKQFQPESVKTVSNSCQSGGE